MEIQRTHTTIKLFGAILKNLKIYRKFQEVGFEYIVNPDTDELHRVNSQSFLGSHNLVLADLKNFIGLTNVGIIPLHLLPNGALVPIYDIYTGKLIRSYTINKCGHCFPYRKMNRANLQPHPPLTIAKGDFR